MSNNGTETEIKPSSVVEIASKSSNEQIREFAMRIAQLREEAANHTFAAIAKLGLIVPFSSGISIASWFRLVSVPTMDTPERILHVGIGVLTGGLMGNFLYSGARNINAAVLARGEINSLTTVLASHIIAESGVSKPPVKS